LAVCRLSYLPSELVILTVSGELLESPEQPISAQRRAERCDAFAFRGRHRQEQDRADRARTESRQRCSSLPGLALPSELVILTVSGELLESPEQPLSAQRRAERCGAVAFQ
jgi:hypothetical protein